VRFVDAFIDKAHRYSLGVEEESATAYLSIPVGSSLTDYEEYYALSDQEYSGLLADSGAARLFAEQCRHLEHYYRVILKPGWNIGSTW
jgi:hypothetical protein